MSFEMGEVASLIISRSCAADLSNAYSSTALSENGTLSCRFGGPNQGPIIHRKMVMTMTSAIAVRL